MYNRVILIGRLTRDPELKYTTNGVAFVQFSVAVNRKFSKNDEADFIDIVVWRGLAENCAKYISKGSQVAVEGRIQVRSYENQEGQKRKITEVVADDVRFLSSKGGSDTTNTSYKKNIGQKDEWEELGREVSLEDIDIVEQGPDEEIPF